MQTDIDLEGTGSGYSGTFRWKRSKKLPSLPQHFSLSPNHSCYGLKNWNDFFASLAKTKSELSEILGFVHSDLALIDCLSVPLSMCFMIKSVTSLLPSSLRNGELKIVCIGCSDKAEERVLRETSAFQQLTREFSSLALLEIWLVGPEISVTADDFISNNIDGLRFVSHLFRGSAIDFFRAKSHIIRDKNAIVVGFNCGFGNFANPSPIKYDLLHSWLPDLYFLTGTRLPLFFTSANDNEDLVGEVAVMQKILGANFIAVPKENAFGYASTFISADESNSYQSTATTASAERDVRTVLGVSYSGESKGYSRGNSFWYAVQGFDRSRRVSLDLNRYAGANCDKSQRDNEFLSVFNRNPLVPCDRFIVSPTPLVLVSASAAGIASAAHRTSDTNSTDEEENVGAKTSVLWVDGVKECVNEGEGKDVNSRLPSFGHGEPASSTLLLSSARLDYHVITTPCTANDVDAVISRPSVAPPFPSSSSSHVNSVLIPFSLHALCGITDGEKLHYELKAAQECSEINHTLIITLTLPADSIVDDIQTNCRVSLRIVDILVANNGLSLLVRVGRRWDEEGRSRGVTPKYKTKNYVTAANTSATCDCSCCNVAITIPLLKEVLLDLDLRASYSRKKRVVVVTASPVCQ